MGGMEDAVQGDAIVSQGKRVCMLEGKNDVRIGYSSSVHMSDRRKKNKKETKRQRDKKKDVSSVGEGSNELERVKGVVK